MAFVQLVTGTSNVATTTVNFTAQPAGTLLVLIWGSDDYRTTAGGGRPESTSWILPPGGAQQTNLGHYLFYKLTNGSETSVQYTIGSASKSVYWLGYCTDSIDQTTPLDISNGNVGTSGSFTATTPSVTTSAGQRVSIATFGGAENPLGATGVGSWTNAYTEIGDNRNVGTGTGDIIGVGTLGPFSGGGSTSTGITFEGSNPDANTSIIAVFKVVAGGGGGPSAKPLRFPAFAAPFIAPRAKPFQSLGPSVPDFAQVFDIVLPPGLITLDATGPVVTSGTGINITVPAGALTLDASAPVVGTGSGVSITVPAGALTLAGTAPVVTTGTAFSAAVPAGALVLSGTQPVVTTGTGTTVTVPAGALVLDATAPVLTVGSGTTITVPAGALILAGTAPTVTTGTGLTVTVPAGALVLAATAPVITTGTGATITVPAGQITLDGTEPELDLGHGTDPNQAFPAFAPMFFSPRQASFQLRGDAAAIPVIPYGPDLDAGIITLDGTPPVLALSAGIAPPAGQITLSATPPAVGTGAALTIAVPAGLLSLDGTEPFVNTGGSNTIPVPSGLITLSATAPVLSVSTATILPPSGLIILDATAPAVGIGSPLEVAVPAGLITLDGSLAQFGGGFFTSPPAGLITLGTTPPIVTGAGNIPVPAGQIILGATPPLILIGDVGYPVKNPRLTLTTPGSILTITTPESRLELT